MRIRNFAKRPARPRLCQSRLCLREGLPETNSNCTDRHFLSSAKQGMSPAKQSNWFREGFFGACSDRTRLTFSSQGFLTAGAWLFFFSAVLTSADAKSDQHRPSPRRNGIRKRRSCLTHQTTCNHRNYRATACAATSSCGNHRAQPRAGACFHASFGPSSFSNPPILGVTIFSIV